MSQEPFAHVEISRDIAASPEAIYDAIADITRMGEWSDECHTCEWLDGATGPAVGARFDGHNRLNGNEWTTQGTVVDAERGRRFAFECSMMDFHFATWSYTIEPTDTGARVTERWDDFRPDFAIEASIAISGVEDRNVRNAENISATLDRLAAALEG